MDKKVKELLSGIFDKMSESKNTQQNTPKESTTGAQDGLLVKYPSLHPDGAAQGFLFKEDDNVTSQGIVLIHEWWGVNEFVRGFARRIMKEGKFTVLAADIHRGHVFTEPKKAREHMMSMDWNAAAPDVGAAARYLKELGCQKVGVLGLCFGGALTMVSAATQTFIDAAAPYCGVPKPGVADITKIKIPIQGHYAAYDKVKGVSSPEDYNNMAQILWDAGVDYEMCVYEAEHAFINPEYGTPPYNEKVTAEFLRKFYDFMHERLR